MVGFLCEDELLPLVLPHTCINRKCPKDSSLGIPESNRISSPISAPLLTAVLLWRNEVVGITTLHLEM